MSRKSVIQEKKCPRCGNMYKYTETRVINGQKYFYAIHIYRDENNRKRVHKCYMGAETYIYVKRVHEDTNIQFHGYTVPNRYQEYMKDIIDYIERDKVNSIIRTWRNKARVRKTKTRTSMKIDPFVKQIFKEKKFKETIITINAIYKKYKAYAEEIGMKIEDYNEIWRSIDNTFRKSEIEQYISMCISGEAYKHIY